MYIQAPARTGVQIAPMQELAPSPSGTVGKLRFTPQQNGTAPASHTSVLPFDGSIDDLGFDLGFDLGDAAGDARARLVQCMAVKELSRCIGSLLGNLTVPADEAHVLVRIAKELVQISELSQGNLSDLAGGGQCLAAYLKAMTYSDLIALCDGIFNHPQAYDAVLEQISPDDLRSQAADVLDQVGEAAFQQLAHVVVSKPLGKIIEMLKVTPMNGEKLAAQLNKLHTGLPMPDAIDVADRFPTFSMLDIYFQSLSEDDLAARMAGLQYKKLLSADNALSKLNDSPEKRQAITMRRSLAKSLGGMMYAQAQPSLQQLEKRLAQLKVVLSRDRESVVMTILTALMGDYDLYGWAPAELIEDVQRLMQEGIEILQEEQYRNALEIPPHSMA